MEFLAKIYNAGSKIEAQVDVRDYQSEIECEFINDFGWCDDELVMLDEVDETLLSLLIDDAHDQWAMGWDES